MHMTKDMFNKIIIDDLFNPTNKTNKNTSMRMEVTTRWTELAFLKELRDKKTHAYALIVIIELYHMLMQQT